VQLKYWPIETNGQAAVWAALELRSKVNHSDLKAIEVFTSKFTWFEIGSEPEKWDPKTRETADHSLPYIFARALVDGPIRVASFNDDAVRDASLRPLMAKIKVIADDTLARKFHETHDVAVSDEMSRLAGEYGKLKEPWVFRPKSKT
jgi:2-methylcitrate dehydratase